jgi:hypothetical protein
MQKKGQNYTYIAPRRRSTRDGVSTEDDEVPLLLTMGLIRNKAKTLKLLHLEEICSGVSTDDTL